MEPLRELSQLYPFDALTSCCSLFRPAVSTGRPCRGAAKQKRYALKQVPLRQHAFVQDADDFNNIVGG